MNRVYVHRRGGEALPYSIMLGISRETYPFINIRILRFTLLFMVDFCIIINAYAVMRKEFGGMQPALANDTKRMDYI